MKRQRKRRISKLLIVLMVIMSFNIPIASYASGTMYEVNFTDYDDTVLDTQSVEENTSATAPTDPVRDGYDFSGWDTDFSSVTRDLTVQAEYTTSSAITITFEDYDGSLIEKQEVPLNGSATPPNDHVRSGYAFTGWDVPTDNLTSNTTATAQYVKSYQIDYQENSEFNNQVEFNTLMNSHISQFAENIYIDFTNLPNGADDIRTFFNNKAETREAKVYLNESNGLNLRTNDAPEIESEMILEFNYIDNITFKDHDGSIIETKEAPFNDSATLPNDRVRSGYAFTGWDVSTDNLTSDTTATAQYVKSYQINNQEEFDTLVNEKVSEFQNKIYINFTNLSNGYSDVLDFYMDATHTPRNELYIDKYGMGIVGNYEPEVMSEAILEYDYNTNISEVDEVNALIQEENLTNFDDIFTYITDLREENTPKDARDFDDDGQTAYSLLFGQHGVCAGYADLTKMMMDYAGYSSTIELGSYLNSDRTMATAHAWNIVDGKVIDTMSNKQDGEFTVYTKSQMENGEIPLTGNAYVKDVLPYEFDNVKHLYVNPDKPIITIDSYVLDEATGEITVTASTNVGTMIYKDTSVFTDNGDDIFSANNIVDGVDNKTKKSVEISDFNTDTPKIKFKVDGKMETFNVNKESSTPEETPVVVPTITIETHDTNPTNSDIAVTATTDVGTFDNGESTKSYTFTENGEFNFVAINNTKETTKTVTINNIDKENPVLTFIYDESETSNPLIVNIEAMDDNAIQSIFTPDNEWVDKSTIEYEILENKTYEFKAKDLAGNITTEILTIDNIVEQDDSNLDNPAPVEPEAPNTGDDTEEDTSEVPVEDNGDTDVPIIPEEENNEPEVETPTTEEDEEQEVLEDEQEEIVEEDSGEDTTSSPAPTPSTDGGGYTPPVFNPEETTEDTEEEVTKKEQDTILLKAEKSSSLDDIASSINEYTSPEDMDDDEFIEQIVTNLDKNEKLSNSLDKESVKSIVTNLIKSKKSDNNKEKLLMELNFAKLTDETIKADFDEVVKANTVTIKDTSEAIKIIEDASLIDKDMDKIKDTKVAQVIKDKLVEKINIDSDNITVDNITTVEKDTEDKKTVKAIESIMNANKGFTFYSDLRAKTYINSIKDEALKEELNTIYNSVKEKHATSPIKEKERLETPPILIDGKETDFSIKKADGSIEKVNPFIKDGRTLSSVRVIAETLEADVKWYGEDQRIELIKGDIVIEMQIDSNKLSVNGKEQLMDTMPIIKDGRSYFPARFVAEGLSSTVLWDSEYNTVFID